MSSSNGDLDGLEERLMETEGLLREMSVTGFRVTVEDIREMEDNSQLDESDCAGGLGLLFLFIVIVSMACVITV